MWITQTYLKSPQPNALLHVYYMYQQYSEHERRKTGMIQKELEGMGHRFGDAVSLSMPNQRSADQIEKEIREVQPLWQAVHDKLPGILVSTKPMSSFEFEAGEHVFFSFGGGKSVRDCAMLLSRISELLDEQLYHQTSVVASATRSAPTTMEKFLAAVELKPCLYGFRVDLKKLFSRGTEQI